MTLVSGEPSLQSSHFTRPSSAMSSELGIRFSTNGDALAPNAPDITDDTMDRGSASTAAKRKAKAKSKADPAKPKKDHLSTSFTCWKVTPVTRR